MKSRAHAILICWKQSRVVWKHVNLIKLYNGNWTERSAIWSEIIRVISKSNERAARVRFEITSIISDQNCTTRSSITTLLDPFWNRTILWRWILDFGVLNIPSRASSKSKTGNALASYLVCKTIHSSITSKQAVLKNLEWKQLLSYIKVRFSSPESVMENHPFSCGWGLDVSLSLEKEFEGAAGAILRWISFDSFEVVKLPGLHDGQLWWVFSF